MQRIRADSEQERLGVKVVERRASLSRFVDPLWRYCVEEHQTFSDGRERERKMLVAEKKRRQEGWSECAIRGLSAGGRAL